MFTRSFLVWSLLAASWAVATPQVGGFEGDFLSWGAGGRALGLGKAYVALASDATASYWNPAGLAWVDRPEASALHAGLWEGGAYDFVGVAFPAAGWGPVGAFATLLTFGGAERRNAENDVLPGTFGLTKFGAGLATAHTIVPDCAVGVTAKYLARWVDHQAVGFITADAGLRWTPLGVPWFTAGVVLQHGMSARFGQTDDELARVLRCGIVVRPDGAGVGAVVADAEWRLGSSAPWQWRVGVESSSLGPLTVRLGLDGWELAGGIGCLLSADLRVDYSGAMHGELGLSHRMSVAVQWGSSETIRRMGDAATAYQEALAKWDRTEQRPFGIAQGGAMSNELKKEIQQLLEEVLRMDPGNAGAARLLERVR